MLPQTPWSTKREPFARRAFGNKKKRVKLIFAGTRVAAPDRHEAGGPADVVLAGVDALVDGHHHGDEAVRGRAPSGLGRAATRLTRVAVACLWLSNVSE